MVKLPKYMNKGINNLLKEITQEVNKDYVSLLTETSDFQIALLLKKEFGQACNLNEISDSNGLAQLTAQSLYPSILYLYQPNTNEIEVFGLGINQQGELKQVDVYRYPHDLLIDQWYGKRIPFEFELEDIIGFSKEMLKPKTLDIDYSNFNPIVNEQALMIKELYNKIIKNELYREL